MMEDGTGVDGASPPGDLRRRWRAAHTLLLALTVVSAMALAGLLLGLLLGADMSEAPDDPKVDLGFTTYVGTRSESGINVFRGMRYARPPLGDLRWRAPVEPEPEGGHVRAKAFGPICLSTSAYYPNDMQDEDCLYVNVWAPADAAPNSKLPIWLFIQGGGYTANSNANYDGEAVVKRSNHSIVFVNFNYRVGLFGFLAGEKVKEDGDLNVGLLDQRFAMQWIKKHISKFGGDPDHIVISGVSAGAGSVALQMGAYGGRDDGLFVGAIIESLFFPAHPYLSDLEWQFDRLVQATACDGTGEQDRMACLRALSTRELQRANVGSPFPGGSQWPLPLFYWAPCVDGDLVRDLPSNLFERGTFVDVPLIIGTDTDEGSYFAADADSQTEMREFIHNNFPRLRDKDLDAIQDQYPLLESLPNHRPWFPSTSKAYGEAVFICPTVNLLDDVTSSPAESGSKNASLSSPVAAKGPWSYRYNVRDRALVQGGLGVPHTFEIPAVFGPDSVGGAAGSYYTYNSPIVPIVMDYWISFVKTLSPNPLRNSDAPMWQPRAAAGNGAAGSDERRRARLVIETANMRMEETPTDEVGRCGFWKSLKNYTQQ